MAMTVKTFFPIARNCSALKEMYAKFKMPNPSTHCAK
jgi:hypothetical protein